jgi:ABC-type bacteriocin/lantibiotic exporter with double-glycine peptidase domain
MRRAALVVALALAGCVAHYSGAARPTSQAALEASPGWILASAPALRQRSLNDCGPTALAIVAARWGVEPERASAAARPRRDRNVSFAELRRAARGLGLAAFVISADPATLEHELRRGRPVVVGLLRPYGRRYTQGHFEVVVGIQPARHLVATIDPAGGWKLRTFEELDAEWKPVLRPAMVILGPREAQALQ